MSNYDPDSDSKHNPALNNSELQDAENTGDEGLGNSGGGQGEAPGALKDKEQSGSGGDQDATSGNKDSDFKFNPLDPTHRGKMGNLFKGVGLNRRKLLAGGGGITGIGTLIVVMFFILIPLKIEHIVTNLEKHFNSTTTNAVENQSEKMLSHYIKSRVIPALRGCSGSTIDKNCNPHLATSENPVRALYKGWSDAGLENKLAKNYGIEFRLNKHTGKYYMKVPGVTARNGDDISSFVDPKKKGEFNKNLFEQVHRGQVRQNVKTALENETLWKKVLYRYKIGRLLEQKYGLKRCVAFCGTIDTFHEHVSDKKIAAQVFLVQRILIPRSETFGIVASCLFNPACSPESTTPSTEPAISESHGAPENPEVDAGVRKKMTELAAVYGKTDKETVDKMIKDYKDMSEGGFGKYFLKKGLEKIGAEFLNDPLNKFGPIATGINTASKIIDGVSKAGPKIHKLTYVTNSVASVQLFMMYRSFADEIHTGKVDPTEVGSLITSLGPGSHSTKNDPQVGGTATAENTPLYSNLMGTKAAPKTVATSLLSSLSSGTAYAAGKAASSSGKSDYLCNDGKPVPAGELVCSEEKLGQGNKSVDAVDKFLKQPYIAPIISVNSYARGFLSGVSKVLASLIPGFISDFFNAALQQIPGLKEINALMTTLMGDLAKEVIPNPFGSNMSGGRSVDMAAAGANVVGNDACTQVGCAAVPTKVAATIINQQQTEERQQFASQSFFARMFNTDSQYSLASKVAMATPLNLQSSAETGMASIVSNPFGHLASAFGNIFVRAPVSAATPASVDPFQIGTVAFPTHRIPTNPEAYWDDHGCGDTSDNGPIAKWQQDAANPDGDPKKDDPNTGMPVHRDVSPCLLIKNTTGAAGGALDSSLLSDADKADINGAGGGSVSGGTTSSTPTTNTSGLVWPFATKNSSQTAGAAHRVDQGWDIQDKPGANIYAIADGKIHQLQPDCGGGFGNAYPTEELKASIGGPSTWVYYGHVRVDPSVVNKDVKAGDLIAHANVTDPDQGGCSKAPTGWLEIGFAQPGTDAPLGHGAFPTAEGQKMKDLLMGANPRN